MSWRATVLSLFPEMFPGPLGLSLAGRALRRGIWSLDAHDLRAYGIGRHRAVDDTPFGGGAGMVLRADVMHAAIMAQVGMAQVGMGQAGAAQAGSADGQATRPLLYPTPRGRRLVQDDVRRYAAGTGIVLLCGRYEGIDERVLEALDIEQVSIGDYVLSGGEPAALVLLDAAVRLLPGVMGGGDSAVEESFSDGLLEYPHYTKPAEWLDRAVPDTLLSGNHAAIAAWRHAAAERDTRVRRPDLWELHRSRPDLIASPSAAGLIASPSAAGSTALPSPAGPRN